ncbi:MAG TPA: hypothetical protein VL727_01370 [Puia sp.]|nr:hypothetical protein [Puia sp.]
MNNRLEDFVRDHREEFDSEEPDNKIWEKISREMDPDKDKKKQTSVVQIPVRWIKWSAAAAAVLLLIVGVDKYFMRGKTMISTDFDFAQKPNPGKQTTAANPANPDSQATVNPSDTSAKNAANLAQTKPAVANPSSDTSALAAIRPGDNKDPKAGQDLQSSLSEEMYHYAKLVEIRHKELKTIEKDEPLLYKQFALDVNKLDSVYRSLREQLPTNPNREQLLEAMLQNLQLQMELLNHQLEIIKQINHSKKSEYEKAYKTV